ncbi:hypothetical protein N7453_011868 [Penicillium expansum]|nr:hypothetical protein N7453_011868 [Penicillium expansum]
MARQSGRLNQNIRQGVVICHIYKGLASAGYQRCRVPGDWVERSGWDSCVSLTSNDVQRSDRRMHRR